MPRKGRARRFREARQLKQGYDDGLFREGSGTLADLSGEATDTEVADDEDWDEDDDALDQSDDDWDPLKD